MISLLKNNLSLDLITGEERILTNWWENDAHVAHEIDISGDFIVYSVAKLVGVEETEEGKKLDKTELERLPKANLEERQKPFDKPEEAA